MIKTSVVDKADGFGRTLTTLGALTALVSITTAVLIAFGTSTTDQTQTAHETLPVWAIVTIGFGGILLGALVAWAGYVLRTLAAIHNRDGHPATVPEYAASLPSR